MKFSYIALNEDRQKLTGILSAESESEARKKLHTLGLSIISLEIAPEDAADTIDMEKRAQKQNIASFVFHVRDKRGNETHGIIDAVDKKTAYYRLISEYNFQVLSLCDASVPEAQQEEEGKKGLEELHEEVQIEYNLTEEEEEQEEQEQSITQTEDFIEIKKELVLQVEEVVSQAQMLLKKFEKDLTGDEVRNIQTKIDHLMRLRLSNNLKYIQDLADELLIEVDNTLKKNAEKLQEKGQEINGIEGGVEESEEDGGALDHIRMISNRMKAILGGDQKPRRRIQLKKKSKKLGIRFARLRLFFRLLKRILWNFHRILVAKNSAVRKRYVKQLSGHFAGVKKVFATPKKKLEILEEEIDIKEQEEEEFELLSEEIEEFKKTFFLRLFEESRLFFGWLLGFYIVYFYFAFFTLTKFPADTPFHAFLYQSITSEFPFLALGIFFLIFLGLTLIIRFTKNNMWYSPLFIIFSGFCILLFLANF